MKTLHGITPPLRYGQFPVLTDNLVVPDMHGHLIDRWAEGKTPMGLWRWDVRAMPTTPVKPLDNIYVIVNDDDKYYAERPEDGKRRYQQHRRDMTYYQGMTWYTGPQYVVRDRDANATTIGEPELTSDEIITIIEGQFVAPTMACEHVWSTDGFYCVYCDQDRQRLEDPI